MKNPLGGRESSSSTPFSFYLMGGERTCPLLVMLEREEEGKLIGSEAKCHLLPHSI
ncbi:hypothetical protein EGR_10204 [Echinococcus granulosus]|uniref:Uncharacterized protein n=1 Tax=Echinococcus granulosus TaxID=6210 RepID=W6U324_ECHGR|nr:hypothetical protein EGR_10204 [Echinococcus granulosus]EUB54946.1 hypothetical protein EGR_10204 [Echinococcus granulosus]